MERLANRFVLEREVGSGGMSTVYLGRDEVLGRSVAVKVLKSGFADTDIGDRFQREGKTAASLSHPNIVPVYDAGEGEVGGREVSYIVMEHVSGGDLKDLLDKRGPLGTKELSRIGREVSEGLAHAHGRGIVHRDIKPHNILLDDVGRPKLTDFGIARALEATRFTQTGSYLGTALYSSPEQLRGGNITAKSDVYSLGATLYQAVAGSAPFQGTAMVVAEKHLSEEPKPPGELRPGIDERLESLILSCLAKDPDERPSAREVASRLADLSRSPTKAAGAAAGVSASTDARSRPSEGARDRGEPPPRKRRYRGFAALAVAAVLAVIGIAAAPSLFGGGPEESASQQNASQENEAASPGVSDGGGNGQSGGAEAPSEPASDESASDESASDESASSGESAPPEADAGGQSSEGSSGELSEGAAADVVEGFYSTAADGDYDRSAEFLSDGLRQRLFPNEATFEGTFGTLESVRFTEGPEVEVSGDTATVTGTTEAVHTDRVEQNAGTWTLVDESGEWKLDDIGVQQV